MKTNYIAVRCSLFAICIIAMFAMGCGASTFGSSFSHDITAPGMSRSEKRVQGMGTNDVKITENYTGAGVGGYAASNVGVPVGQPGSMLIVPAAPQSYLATETNLNTIPYVENRTVKDLKDQHRAIQNLRDIERCRAQGGSNCK
ncbi:MAG: hypothetical protein WCW31_05050 [Patescibacteria group bacterium]